MTDGQPAALSIVDSPSAADFLLGLDVITMTGQEFLVATPREPPAEADAEWWFPHGLLEVGEAPADAARRLVTAWTGTAEPKLEVVDFLTEDAQGRPGLFIVFRAVLMAEPEETEAVEAFERFPRGGLPERVGRLEGAWVESALKTSLNYKLTRG